MKFAFKPEIEFNPQLSARALGLCVYLFPRFVGRYWCWVWSFIMDNMEQPKKKRILLISFLLPHDFVLEFKTWHFVPWPLLSAYFHICFLSIPSLWEVCWERWSCFGCGGIRTWRVAFVTIRGIDKNPSHGGDGAGDWHRQALPDCEVR